VIAAFHFSYSWWGTGEEEVSFFNRKIAGDEADELVNGKAHVLCVSLLNTVAISEEGECDGHCDGMWGEEGGDGGGAIKRFG